MREPREAWRDGPYVQRACELHAHAAGLDMSASTGRSVSAIM